MKFDPNCRQQSAVACVWIRVLMGAVTMVVLGTGSAYEARGEDWPRWRGPEGNGISRETGWLDRWPDAGVPVRWKVNVGLGFSCMAVAGSRVVTMGNANNTDTVWCLDAATGEPIWKHSYPADLGDKYFDGGTAGTPTLAGDRVYTLSRWGDLFCLDRSSGRVVWSKNVQSETGASLPGWGFGGSPVVHGDRLLLNVGDAGLALNKETGAILWQSEPTEAGYSTPYLVKRGGRTLALLGSGKSYVAVDAADGGEVWRVRWLTQYGVNAADPIVKDSILFISTGYGKGAISLDWSASDAEPQERWKSKTLRTQMTSAVLWQDHLYGLDGDSGPQPALKCLDFKTGDEVWAEPAVGSGGLIVADGKLIVISARGELMVAPATPEGFQPTARQQVLGGNCWTAPVLANGAIYARNGRGDLVSVDVSPAKP
jgi:outer membrane protein assembly factor BamB